MRQVADAPGHNADFWMWEQAESGLVKMIKVRVGQQDEVNRGQIFEAQAGPFNSFEQEESVGEIGIDQDIQVGELNQKRRVADPSHRDLAVLEFGKHGLAM